MVNFLLEIEKIFGNRFDLQAKKAKSSGIKYKRDSKEKEAKALIYVKSYFKSKKFECKVKQ